MIALLLAGLVGATTISDAFEPPAGFERVPADAFGTWLQERPVLSEDEPVRTHAGDVVGHKARVVDMPLVKGDLQQCADSVIRLRAEWLRETEGEISFHATSGDPLPWKRFAAGETPYDAGNKIAWKPGSTGKWDDWLARVFMWAGTDSLERLDTVPSKEPRPGDLLVQGGFPGHAVAILDVATDGERTLLLLGEGFMPAQSFHVELGPQSGWWTWEPGVDLGHWAFDASHLRSFR